MSNQLKISKDTPPVKKKNEFIYQMAHIKTMIKNNEIAFDVLFLRKSASETCIHIFD